MNQDLLRRYINACRLWRLCLYSHKMISCLGLGESGVKYLPYRNRALSLISRTWVFVILVFCLFTKHSSAHL